MFLLSLHHLPAPEQQRIGVYVLAVIVGLLVAGIITCLKEMAREPRR